ncbi:MAG: SDR family oxidoreductase [Candidatus Schekmanbacteria bacterium]|nr:SDR family oxidoreductase [Candidatus Schekmanbacteria bacterium]
MSYATAFANKVALVTGASSGIGRELSLRLGRAGARIGLLARSADKLAAARDAIDGGENVLLLPADVADEAACRDAVDRLAATFGGIDLVINNAGLSMYAPFAETETAVFHRLMDVNYFGSLYIAKRAYPHLLRSKGSMVFVSSVVGKRGFPTRSGYSAAKFAVHGLFECLRTEWAATGIHVGIVAPGFTDTGIRAAALSADGTIRGEDSKIRGSAMSAADAAEAILEAAARRRREVVLTPAGTFMVWLNKLLPGLADRLAARAIG